MGSHPANLALRFGLEVIALVGLGAWGWQLTDGPMRYLAALGVPVAAAALWGTFNVPGDPSRSGKAPVAVPGIARLALELAFFVAAALGLFVVWGSALSGAFALAILFHYVVSYDRVQWLLHEGKSDTSSRGGTVHDS